MQVQAVYNPQPKPLPTRVVVEYDSSLIRDLYAEVPPLVIISDEDGYGEGVGAMKVEAWSNDEVVWRNRFSTAGLKALLAALKVKFGEADANDFGPTDSDTGQVPSGEDW